jgi:hypothetical protein
MNELLSASSVTLSAWIGVAASAADGGPHRRRSGSPRTYPEPLAATPTVPLMATAAEPAKTSELMVWSASEVTRSAVGEHRGIDCRA